MSKKETVTKTKVIMELENCKKCCDCLITLVPFSTYGKDYYCSYFRNKNKSNLKLIGRVMMESNPRLGPIPDWCPRKIHGTR